MGFYIVLLCVIGVRELLLRSESKLNWCVINMARQKVL